MDKSQKMTKPIQSSTSASKPNAVEQAVLEETSSPRTRRAKAIGFQIFVGAMIAAFAVLTFLVVTIPAFSIDLRITQGLQSIDNSGFSGLMNLISWAGFGPQAFIITLIIIAIIYFLGFRW